jgi:hypothetical protein
MVEPKDTNWRDGGKDRLRLMKSRKNRKEGRRGRLAEEEKDWD